MSLINHLYANAASVEPEVGMGATVLMWSDRQPATITRISPSGKSLWIRGDKATRTDNLGMSDAQSYDYAPGDPSWPESQYTLRKNGRWVRKGDPMSGQSIRVGNREKYHDYSF